MKHERTATEAYYHNKIRYYSFRLRFGQRHGAKYMLLDLKVAAIDLRTAITIFMISIEVMKDTEAHRFYKNHDAYGMPLRGMVKAYILQVLEYHRLYKPEYGYTLHRYKKTRIYNPQDFLPLFKEEY